MYRSNEGLLCPAGHRSPAAAATRWTLALLRGRRGWLHRLTRIPAVGYSPLLTVVILVGFGTAGTAFGSLVIASRGMADGDQGLVGGVINITRLHERRHQRGHRRPARDAGRGRSRRGGHRRGLERGARGRRNRPFGIMIVIDLARGR